jgi:hypothetical protein
MEVPQKSKAAAQLMRSNVSWHDSFIHFLQRGS